MRDRMTMLLSVLGAGLGWAALALQLVLTLVTIRAQDGSVLDGLWRFFSFFTIIANIFAAIVLSLAVLRRGTARVEFAAVTTMILVGVTYSLLLRDTWNPQGWQKVADVLLHDAMPLIVILFWLLRPHRRLAGADIAATTVLPLGYIAYAMTRGAMDGWYAYGFLDVSKLGPGPVALNCTGLGLAFLVMAIALTRLDRILP